MNVRLRLIIVACFAGFALTAFAQGDYTGFAAELRAKYGPALARETFIARPGIEMIVDYAYNGHVCRIQLPPVGPGKQPGVLSRQGIDDLVVELVPVAIRGTELRRGVTHSGLGGISFIDYEYVTIAESLRGTERTGVTITFAKERCRDQVQ